MFAIIRQGNKQYRVSEGDTLRIDLMNAENGSSFETDHVLAVVGEGDMKISRPQIKDSKVQFLNLIHI